MSLKRKADELLENGLADKRVKKSKPFTKRDLVRSLKRTLPKLDLEHCDYQNIMNLLDDNTLVPYGSLKTFQHALLSTRAHHQHDEAALTMIDRYLSKVEGAKTTNLQRHGEALLDWLYVMKGFDSFNELFNQVNYGCFSGMTPNVMEVIIKELVAHVPADAEPDTLKELDTFQE